MKLNNYDGIAKYYDVLSRMVFFKSQINAQKDQLHYITANSKLLIVGGGTGWIIDEISKLYPDGLEITYIEVSGNMIQLARKRNLGGHNIEFIHLPVEEFVSNQSYDLILTAFLFDNFAKDRITQVFSKLSHLLKPGGLWFFTDFINNSQRSKMWQTLLLKSMYLFFRKLSNIEAKALVNTAEHFKDRGFNILSEHRYYGGFITSIVYQKTI